MLFALLFACSGSLIGDWSGDCLFYDDRTEESIAVLASVKRDNGYILEGKMTITNWDDDEFSGDLSGDHTGKYVLLKSDFETEDGTYRFRIETERIGNQLEGTCTIKSPQAAGGLSGDIELEN